MMQPQQPVQRASASMQFYNICSWGWGVFGVIIGIAAAVGDPVPGIAMSILGIALLPAVRRMYGRVIGVKPALGASVASGVGILALMMLFGARGVREAKVKEERRMKLAREEDRRDSALVARYPYVDRDSLRAWREHASDSATNADDTFASFLRKQEAWRKSFVADSIARGRQLRSDSIASAKRNRADSLKAAREERSEGARQARLLQQTETGSSGTYKGHTIYVGPRGGRYYINSNGNKTYIH
jgi:hypothetical protein